MSITQNNSNIDFSNANSEQKKELIDKLLKKQFELAQFLIDNYPDNIDLRIHLMFIQMVCVSKFGEYFSGFIPNEVMSEDHFALLFACKLDDYMCMQAQNINAVVQSLQS